jgi:hypothetical protein
MFHVISTLDSNWDERIFQRTKIHRLGWTTPSQSSRIILFERQDFMSHAFLLRCRIWIFDRITLPLLWFRFALNFLTGSDRVSSK